MDINLDYYTNYEDEEELKKYNNFLKNYSERVEKILKQALKSHDIKATRVYLGIGVVTKDEIHKLNNEFRKVDRDTDVLSFPIFSREEIASFKGRKIEEELSIGDIVLCMDVIENQAVEYGTGFDREMLYMITHGICHLLGYDHEIEEEKKQMRAREEELLAIVKE